MQLANGATPILAFKNMDTGVGMKDACGLVMARRGVGDVQWVVWDIAKDEGDEVWDCHNGDYFDTRPQAEYSFGLRLARYHLPGVTERGMKDAQAR